MIWPILALFLPCLMVIIFTQIVQNKWIGFFVSTIIIGASVYKGFFHNEIIILLDVISLVVGFYIVDTFKIDKIESR
nr:CsbA family protein [Mammaliicoccus sp. Marseille-Q6498]